MRPRRYAADNARPVALAGAPTRPASMRPRRYAAENRATASEPGPTSSFNEAAALCRGKREHERPRTALMGCFNEAAALCRGKQATRKVSCRARCLLQ